jgi:hypothetical protein
MIRPDIAQRYIDDPKRLEKAISQQKEIISDLSEKLKNPIQPLTGIPLSQGSILKYQSILEMTKRRLEEHLVFQSEMVK